MILLVIIPLPTLETLSIRRLHLTILEHDVRSPTISHLLNGRALGDLEARRALARTSINDPMIGFRLCLTTHILRLKAPLRWMMGAISRCALRLSRVRRKYPLRSQLPCLPLCRTCHTLPLFIGPSVLMERSGISRRTTRAMETSGRTACNPCPRCIPGRVVLAMHSDMVIIRGDLRLGRVLSWTREARRC
jgi:hypothetical protein